MKGNIFRADGPPGGEWVNISYQDHVAVLSKDKLGEKETWLLTGWRSKAPGEPGEGYGSVGPTHEEPRRTRPSMGAGAERIISPAAQKGKGAGLIREMVEQAFPGAEVVQSRITDGCYVRLPDGLRIVVLPHADIAVPSIEELRQAGYSEADLREIAANPDEWYPSGQLMLIERGGLIKLAKGVEGEKMEYTLRHEAFHAACDLVLTDRQRQAVLREFGDWGSAARAYETWRPEERAHSIFQKILDFFRRIWEAFRPTWEGTFGRLAGGVGDGGPGKWMFLGSHCPFLQLALSG